MNDAPDLSTLVIDRGTRVRRRRRWLNGWTIALLILALAAAGLVYRSRTARPVVEAASVTTAYPSQTFTLLNATVNIAYNTIAGQKTARFTGMVITEAMSQGGDSGSLIVDMTENKAVGLLFAGSNLATIFIPIDNVLTALNITI